METDRATLHDAIKSDHQDRVFNTACRFLPHGVREDNEGLYPLGAPAEPLRTQKQLKIAETNLVLIM